MDNLLDRNKRVKQRKGTTDLGRKYESHLAALYAIKCALDQNISDFNIGSNLEDYGDFDDIIIDVLHKDDSRKKYLIQLKHKETKDKILSAQALLKDKGNFSLHKYEKSYETIISGLKEEGKANILSDINVIILTNADLKPEPLPSLKLTEIPSRSHNLLNTLENSKVWKIEQDCQASNPQYNQHFLQHLFLLTNQIHANDIENMITYLLNIDKKTTKLVLNFFDNWVEGKKVDHYMLCKEDVEMKITEITLEMLKIPLDDELSFNIDASILFNYVVTDYDITFLSIQEKQEIIKAITWKVQNRHMWLNKQNANDIRIYIQILNRRKGQYCSLDEISLVDVYLAMWEKGEIPLMIDCWEAHKFKIAKDIITKFANVKRKFIIFTTNESNTGFNDYRVFDNLASLDANKMLYVFNQLKLSFQERERTTHKQFSHVNHNLIKFITPNLFTKLTFCEVNCGEAISTSEYTVPRYVKKRMVHLNIVREILNHCIIINEENKNMFLQMLSMLNLNDPSVCVLESKKANGCETLPLQIRYNIMKLIKEKKDNYCRRHFFFWEPQFLYNGSPLLEWIYSNDNSELIELISRNLVDIKEPTPETRQFFIQASKALDHFQMPITIFCNNSGMGKTVTLRHIAKNCPSHIWVVYIDLSTNPKSLKHLTDENVDIITILKSFLGMAKAQSTTLFFCEMFKLKLRDKEVLFLIDSYDIDETKADKLIDTLLEVDNRIWVSARSCKQQSLQKKMKTVSIQLIGFNRIEAKDAFEATLTKDRYDWDPTETESVLKNLSDELISIPLLVKMLSNIIMKDGKEVFNTTITEIDLYERFMDRIDKRDLITIKKLALTLFFKQEDLEGVIDWKELETSRDHMIEQNQRNFVLDGFDGKRPQFIHHSYAEYLAAKYLADAKGRLKTNKSQFKILIEDLCYVGNVNIRNIFDKILSKTLPLHEAIINDDIEKVTNILNDKTTGFLQDQDEYGRTPLHLASSYGKIFRFKGDTEITALYHSRQKLNIVSVDNPNSRLHGENIFRLILKNYTNSENLLEDKDVLGFNVYDFAYKCGCLINLNTLHSYTRASWHYPDSILFIYHSIRNGLNSLLEKKDLHSLCHVTCNNENLINTTVQYCNTNVIQTAVDKARECRCHGREMNYTDTITKYTLLHSACKRRDDEMESVISLLFRLGAARFGDSRTKTPLHIAAEIGNVQCIKVLLSHNVRVDATDDNGMSALHRVCIHNHLNCCVELLKSKIKIDKSDNKGNTAVHIAAMFSSTHCMTQLLESGAKVETENGDGYTPLMLAALHGHAECVSVLLKHGADVKQNTKKQPAAILVACCGKSIKCSPIRGVTVSMTTYPDQNALSQTIQILLDYGAFIDAKDKCGNTAFMLAIEHGHLHIADFLLTRKASIHSMNKDGCTPLTYAICRENIKYVKMLIENSVNLHGKDQFGNTNFMNALQTRNYDIILALLQQENSDVCEINTFNQTALALAVLYDLPYWIEALLAKHVPVDEPDKEGRTAIMVSIVLRRRECFDILLRNKASLKGKTKIEKDTVLLLAIRFGFEEIIPALLEHKVVLDTVSQDGYTALSLSVLKGNTTVTKSLLDAGASVNKANQCGYTALMFAAETGNENLVRVLLESGADKTKFNYNNQNAYKIAQQKGHSLCCSLLQS